MKYVIILSILWLNPLNPAFAVCLDVDFLGHPCRYPSGDNWCQQKYHSQRPFAYLSQCTSLPRSKVNSVLSGNYIDNSKYITGKLQVKEIESGKIYFRVSIATKGCLGDLEGVAYLLKTKNLYQYSGTDGCLLSLRFNNQTVSVREDSYCNFHGLQCNFEAVYRKISAR